MEVLVCISIIGVIVALVLPAVLHSRAAARQVSCTNNVRNLGLALNSFVGVHGHFPVLPGQDFPQSSAFVQLLPHLDQSNLYEKLLSSDLPGGFVLGPVVPEIDSSRPSVLVCPEDGTAVTNRRTTCYATNEGWPIPPSQKTGLARDGVMYQNGGRENKVFPQAITSGLSNTAAIAEIVPWGNGIGPWTVYGGDPLDRVPDLTPTGASAKCRQATGSSSSLRGRLWSWFYPGSTGYSHIMLPNEKSCNGAWGSASKHRGGVQVSLCDGSVRFVSDAVDPNVWLVLGSRIGGM